ncbi:hypothetical protein WA158_001216 [Blastocystis sp. Blastoise]
MFTQTSKVVPLLKVMQVEKKVIRKNIQVVLKGLSKENKEEQSSNIFKKLSALNEYKSAKSIAFYLPMSCEVNTDSIFLDSLKNKRYCFVPQIVSPQDIEMVELLSKEEVLDFPKDKWGIPIPINNEERNLWNHPEKKLDLIIVPGVAFDSHCNRCGHGKGFYDIFFEKYSSWCTKNKVAFPTLVGIGFDEQIIPLVPMSETDKKLDYIISNTYLFKKE